MTGADVLIFRTKLGLSQSQLAVQINQIDRSLRVHPTTISRWENGKHNPSLHAIAAMQVLERRHDNDEPLTPVLRASEHLELAAAGFEADGSPGLAAALRKLAAGQRESGHDPLQITQDGMLPH